MQMEKNVTGNIIELKGITKRYEDNFTAVEDFNLEVRKGEFVTFLGPSGCGKTTTLRMIAGFDIPTEGKILLNGEDISKLPPNKRPINTVFQRYALFPHLNIFDNIAFGLKLQNKYTRKEIAEKVRHALEVVDLEGFEKRNVTTLSGGQQQRVAIARAIAADPDLILADEPCGNLDSRSGKEVMELLLSRHKCGKTVILITHSLSDAKYADRILTVCDGKLYK